MTSHYPDLGSASDWSFRIVLVIGWSKIPTQIWVVKYISMEHLAGVFIVRQELSPFYVPMLQQLRQ